MREIKYRQAVYDYGKFTGWHYWGFIGGKFVYPVSEVGGIPLSPDAAKRNSTQYTGLKDRNGKEIYEGDIVEWDDRSDGRWRRRCVVKYTPAHYRLVGYFYDVATPQKHTPISFECGAFAYENQTEDELEVIGNIYENPELAKKETP